MQTPNKGVSSPLKIRTNPIMPVVKEELDEDSEYRRTTLRSTIRNDEEKAN